MSDHTVMMYGCAMPPTVTLYQASPVEPMPSETSSSVTWTTMGQRIEDVEEAKIVLEVCRRAMAGELSEVACALLQTAVDRALDAIGDESEEQDDA